MAGKRFFTITLFAFLLAACGPEKVIVKEPVRVEIPVPVKRQPPRELVENYKPDLPVFVLPTDPKATSALTAEGEKKLKRLLLEQKTRLDSWKAWATHGE